MLENATAENSTTHLFHLNNASTDRAQELLEGRSIDALIIIPKNFSTAFATMVNNSTRTVITSSVGQQALSTGGNASLGAGATVCGANVVLPKAGNVTPALQIQGDTGYVNLPPPRRLSPVFLLSARAAYKRTPRREPLPTLAIASSRILSPLR